MLSKRTVWLVVFGIIFVVSTGFAIRLTVSPLSTTEALNPSDKAAASLCPGGNGTNTKIKQLAIPYILQKGFTQSFVCNDRIDTVTYQQSTPYDLYVLSALSFVVALNQALKRKRF